MPSSGLNAGDSESCKVMIGSLPARSSQWSRSCCAPSSGLCPLFSARVPGIGVGVTGRGVGLSSAIARSQVRNKAKTSVIHVLAVLSPSRMARTLFVGFFSFLPGL